MAINSKRRAIQYMVYGALPPHTTNVLWMDTSVPDLPVCKIFWNGAWTPVHTDESKEIAMLVDAIKDLTETCNAQEQTVTELTEEIDGTIKEAVLLGHPARISEYNAEQHYESWFNYHGIEKINDVWYIRWCILQYNNQQEIYFYKYVYTEGVPTLGAPIYTKEGNIFTQEYVVYNLDWERPQEYAKAQALENAKLAILGSDNTASNTALKGLITGLSIPTVSEIQNGLAKETSVKDGNDTAVSVAKEVRSEVGTGSDTAAESGTLFAVVKWIKDKVKSIYNSIADSTNGLVAIKNAIPSVASIQNGLATESNATSNKNAIIQVIEDNAGIPEITIPATTTTQELAPNVVYKFAERTTALTLTLGAETVGQVNDYHLFLKTGSTAPTITWPAGLNWTGGNAPTIADSKIYEIDILNTIAICIEV